MPEPFLGNAGNTGRILQQYELRAQKKYGQNFLVDAGILEKIVNAAKITQDDFVLEIGPGLGTMTQYLCEKAREVCAVEIDRNLIPVLHDTLKETMAHMKRVNEQNRELLQNSLEMVQFEMNLLQSLKTAPETADYNSNAYSTGTIMGSGTKRFDAKQ